MNYYCHYYYYYFYYDDDAQQELAKTLDRTRLQGNRCLEFYSLQTFLGCYNIPPPFISFLFLTFVHLKVKNGYIRWESVC